MRESIKTAIFGILKKKEKYNQTYFHTLQSFQTYVQSWLNYSRYAPSCITRLTYAHLRASCTLFKRLKK